MREPMRPGNPDAGTEVSAITCPPLALSRLAAAAVTALLSKPELR
jgi:hypothetical protein